MSTVPNPPFDYRPVYSPELLARESTGPLRLREGLERLSAKGELKAKLLLVALTHFASKGYDGVQVKEVAEEAGVSKPTLYYHFGSKEGLFRQLCLVSLASTEYRIQGLVAPILEGPLGTPEEVDAAALALGESYLFLLLELPEFAGFILRSIAVPAPDSGFRDLMPLVERVFSPLGHVHPPGLRDALRPGPQGSPAADRDHRVAAGGEVAEAGLRHRFRGTALGHGPLAARHPRLGLRRAQAVSCWGRPSPGTAMPALRAKPPIRYRVSPIELTQHELRLDLELPSDLAESGPVLTLPAWTPGSYLVRDYARLLDRVELRDTKGRPHSIEKIDKQSWRLPALKGGARLSYRIFCNDLTVRTNHADRRHAQLIGAATFLHAAGEFDRPCEVSFAGFPKAWSVATALREQDGVFHAPDYDTLVDSPIELGTFRLHAFKTQGTLFDFAVTGEHPGDETRMVAATRKIVEACAEIFGGFPFKRYLFLLTLSPGARGGLEHKDSTSLLHDPANLDTPSGYHDLYTLIAHEFFHVWNVKRIKDTRLDRFDYTRENHSRLLWFHEGLTSYLQHLIVLRAGVVPFAAVARSLAATWTENVHRPGRAEQSLEESSWDAWIRQYKPNEFTPNSTVGYYDKGSLVGWMMDARIRLGSRGKHGLEDLFRMLWLERGESGITDAQVRAAFQSLSGEPPDAFWTAYISGRAELDSAAIEQAFGLRFEARAPWEQLSPEEAGDPALVARAKAFTGLTLAKEAPTVVNVAPASPAWKAGLSYGMELVAVNGWRVTTGGSAQKRLQDLPVGAEAEILASDQGRVGRFRLRIAENPTRSFRILPDPKARPSQRQAFRAWSGQDFPAHRPAAR